MMALSSHRKLNVEQLINLAQVYWDDPGKLLEIVEATEARKDPAAQLLFGAVSNRLSRLRSDPVRALGETAPDLAALIAARLGVSKPQVAAGDDNEPGISVVEADPQAAPRQRRRWPVAAALLLALTGGAAWWLWPRSEDPDVSAAQGEIGIEIQEGGLLPVADEEKKATASGLPPGLRRPEIPPRPVRDPFARDHTDDEAETVDAADAGRKAASGRTPPAAKETTVEVKPVGDTREAAAVAEARGATATAAGRGGAASGAATTAAAPRLRPALGQDGASGGGVVVEEALLQCYLTDTRPDACAPAGSRGRGSARGSSGGAPGSGASTPMAAAPAAAVESRSGGGSSASRSGGTSERADAETLSSRSATAGSGTATGGSSPISGSGDSSRTSSAARASASTSAGGGSKASQPSKTAPPQSPKAAVVQPAPDPDCPENEPEGRVVFVFDGSISMGLPLGLDPAEEDRLDEGVRRRDPEARREYRALLQQSGPKRMGRAQAAFADAAAELPQSLELGLVVFQECRDIRKVGVFDGGSRGNAIDYVQKLTPRGRTPLAQSLLAAGEMLGDGKSSIVLLTDGIEFCGGDPCAVAEEVKAARPETPIHIVDVTGQARTACVAEITGGRSYTPAEADDLARVIRNALRGAAPHCGAAAASTSEEPRR